MEKLRKKMVMELKWALIVKMYLEGNVYSKITKILRRNKYHMTTQEAKV